MGARFHPRIGPLARGRGQDLGVFACRGPEAIPLRFGDYPDDIPLDIGSGPGLVVALQGHPQERGGIGGSELGETPALGHSEVEQMIFGQRLEQFRGPSEAHPELEIVELDLEIVEGHIHLDHPSRPLAFDQDDGADVEFCQRQESIDLLPRFRKIVGSPLEPDLLDEILIAGQLAVEPLQGLEDGVVHPALLDVVLAAPTQKPQTLLPPTLGHQLVVEELEQRAGGPIGPRLVEGQGYGNEIVEEKLSPFQAGEPIFLDGVETTGVEEGLDLGGRGNSLAFDRAALHRHVRIRFHPTSSFLGAATARV